MSAQGPNCYGSFKHPLSKDEDAPPFIWRSADGRELILGVFDGMGGRGAFSVTYHGHKKTTAWLASRLAAKAVYNFAEQGHFTKEKLQEHLRLVFSDHALPKPVTKIKFQPSSLYPTTLAVIHLKLSSTGLNFQVWWAGDSRVYYVSSSGLKPITTDHSVETGIDSSPLNKWISQVDHIVEESPKYTIKSKIKLLLCSDGVYTTLSSKNLLTLLNSSSSPKGPDFDSAVRRVTPSDDMSLAWVSIDNPNGTFEPQPRKSCTKDALQELKVLENRYASSLEHFASQNIQIDLTNKRSQFAQVQNSQLFEQPKQIETAAQKPQIKTVASSPISGYQPLRKSFKRENPKTSNISTPSYPYSLKPNLINNSICESTTERYQQQTSTSLPAKHVKQKTNSAPFSLADSYSALIRELNKKEINGIELIFDIVHHNKSMSNSRYSSSIWKILNVRTMDNQKEIDQIINRLGVNLHRLDQYNTHFLFKMLNMKYHNRNQFIHMGKTYTITEVDEILSLIFDKWEKK